LGFDDVLRSIQNQFAQLLRRVRRPSSHGLLARLPHGGAASIGGNGLFGQIQPGIV
jgi:hypothetical protein